MAHRLRALKDRNLPALLVAILLIFGSAAHSQNNYTNTSAWGYKYNNVLIPGTLSIPADTFAIQSDKQNYPYIAYKDSLLYLWSPTLHRWNTNGARVGGGSGGGVDYTTKQNYTDSSTWDATRYWVSSLLANYTPTQRLLDSMTAVRVRYLKSTDTAWLHLQVTNLQSAPGGNFIFKFPLNYNSVNHEVTINTFTPAYNANRLQGNYVEPSTPTVAGKFLGYDIINGVWRPMTPDSAAIAAAIAHLHFYATGGLTGSSGPTVNVMDTVSGQPILDALAALTATVESIPTDFVSYTTLADTAAAIRAGMGSGENIANADLIMDATHTLTTGTNTLSIQNVADYTTFFKIGENSGGSGFFNLHTESTDGRALIEGSNAGTLTMYAGGTDDLLHTSVEAHDNHLSILADDDNTDGLHSAITISPGALYLTSTDYFISDLPAAAAGTYQVVVYAPDVDNPTMQKLYRKPMDSLGFPGGSMTTTARNALTPTEGLTIYNTTTHHPNYYNGSAWVEL